MKSFVAAIILVVVIVISSTFYVNNMDRLAGDLTDINMTTYNCILGGKYAEAENSIGEFKEYLDSHKVLLAATGDHEEILRIELAAAELSAYTKDGMYGDALSKCLTIDVMLRRLPANYKIKAENIL